MSKLWKRLAGIALLLIILAGSGAIVARAQPSQFAWNPEIAIVWPQDGQGHQTTATQSRAVNVSV